VLNKLLPLLLLTLLPAAAVPAQDVEARFTADKSTYLTGEPVYAVLAVSNKTNAPIWIGFGPTNMFCQNFFIEVPGADSAREQWGCGYGGSCGRGLLEVAPGKTAEVRQLLNREFRLQRPRAYVIRARTTLTVRSENHFSSPSLEEFAVSDNLNIDVQAGVEEQLQAAFQPIVKELSSTDLIRRGEAATAIIETAPPFLEDVLIELAKTDYGFAAMTALRRADTQKTRDALARIATDSGNQFRVEAIDNLGRTGDGTYLPALLQLMKSTDIQIQGAAAEAVANLGGATAIPAIKVLLSSADLQMRQAGVNSLEYTHAREAVPILIGLLIDSDATIRQTAVGGLWVLTHHVAFDGDQWADVTTPQSASDVHQRWLRWWKSQGKNIEIHGMEDCTGPESLD
jgi:HEAT repeats